MTNKLIIGSLAGMTLVGALAFTPLVANAETAVRKAGTGVGLHDGSGNGGNGGGYQASLDARAKAVGMTSAELTEALKTKDMDDILADKKISTTDFQSKMAAASKARWEAKGLSADEVQKRVDWQKNRHATATHDGNNEGQGGYGRQNR